MNKNIGRFAEWLGAGLQNQLQRFESATDLYQSPFAKRLGIFCSLSSQACLNEIREKKDLLPEAVKGDWMKGFLPLIMRKARGLTNNPLPTSNQNLYRCAVEVFSFTESLLSGK